MGKPPSLTSKGIAAPTPPLPLLSPPRAHTLSCTEVHRPPDPGTPQTPAVCWHRQTGGRSNLWSTRAEAHAQLPWGLSCLRAERGIRHLCLLIAGTSWNLNSCVYL